MTAPSYHQVFIFPLETLLKFGLGRPLIQEAEVDVLPTAKAKI